MPATRHAALSLPDLILSEPLTDNCRQRLEYLERAQAHAQLGNRQAAYECYQKAVDICPAVAKQFIEVLQGSSHATASQLLSQYSSSC